MNAPASQTDVRVALVSGASRGIGRAIALNLAAQGRRVILASRSAEALESLKDEIESDGGSAGVLAVDVGDRQAWQDGIERVAKDEGRLDILVNNAGITRDNLVLRMSDEEFMDVINVNLVSAFVAIRAAARSMMRAKWGRIINIASTSGVIGNPGQANYAASKAGLIGMTKSVARELGGKGITANVIAPGFVETDMTNVLGDEIKSRVLDAMALRRLGQPGDIASAVGWLAGEESGFVTGQVLCVDGGLTMC